MAFQIKLENNNIKEVLAALKTANSRVLFAIGTTIQGAASENSPKRTGALSQSWVAEVEETDTGGVVVIGVPMDALDDNYAKYVEAGTTKMAPHHMLVNACNENVSKFPGLAITEYKNA